MHEGRDLEREQQEEREVPPIAPYFFLVQLCRGVQNPIARAAGCDLRRQRVDTCVVLSTRSGHGNSRRRILTGDAARCW